MKISGKLKFVGLTLIFIIILHFVLRYLGLVLYPKVNNGTDENGNPYSQDYASYYFTMTPRNSIDEVFIGSSHQFCTIDVNILNKEYGMNSILLTSAAQNLTYSYYAAMEAIELQHPEKIVLEVNGILDEKLIIQEPFTSFLMDNMPNWSLTKLKCAIGLGLGQLRHYYPITIHHDNWKDLTLKDFLLPEKLEDGERFVYVYPIVKEMDIPEPISRDEKLPLNDYAYSELTKITQLCKDNGVELILYVAPYFATEKEQMMFNSVGDFAQENDLRFINMFYETENAGIDSKTDYLDYLHLNRDGQIKITRYMGQQGFFS